MFVTIDRAVIVKAFQKESNKGVRYKFELAIIGGDVVTIGTLEDIRNFKVQEGDIVKVSFKARLSALYFNNRAYLMVDASGLKIEKVA